jgi:hypothetical protein
MASCFTFIKALSMVSSFTFIKAPYFAFIKAFLAMLVPTCVIFYESTCDQIKELFETI